jgi:hypothetical protein
VASAYTATQIRHRLDDGRWVAVRRGIYAEREVFERAQSDSQGRYLMDAAAALLRAKPGAAASHTCAGRLYGVSFIGGWPVTPTITVAPDPRVKSQMKQTRTLTRRVAQLPDTHVTTAPGVRTTTPPRTVVDLARELPFAEAVVVADGMLRTGLLAKLELDPVLAFCRRWPGVDRARAVVEFADARAESPVESYGRAALHLEGLRDLEPQVWLYDDRGLIGRVDLYSAAHFTVIEFDGLVKYDGSDEGALLAEKLRQERLEEAGFVVVRATLRQLQRECPRTADRVRAGFRRSVRQRADAAPGEFTGYVGEKPPHWALRLDFTPRVVPKPAGNRPSRGPLGE